MKNNNLSIYIHIPFCIKKCLYCDFVSFSDLSFCKKYITALIEEIKHFKTDKTISSIFIGGGTPSCIDPKYILEIFSIINNHFKIDDKCEITIEANPGTLNKESLIIYKQCGINRLSLGVQSSDDELLKKLGRIHTFTDFLKTYKLSRSMGFTNINVDLMFSLPDQSFNSWKDTLNKIVSLEPEHISAYSLIIEEGTPFYNMDLRLPDDVVDRNMYHYAVEYLSKNGYVQYEISNFSKKGKECQHNIVYWQRGDYKGFGLAGASLLGNIRYKNTENLNDYINGCTVIEKEILTKRDEMSEYVFLGLRMNNGISLDEFKYNFNVDFYSVFKEAVNKNISLGLLIKNKDRICLSKKGIDISNTVFIDFLGG